MGTRSRIAKVNEDGSVKSIYCHWDGYPSNNGVLLFDNYQDPAKIDALLALGDISSLDAEIGEKHDFDNAPNGVVNAYGRDRGETDVDPRVDADLLDFASKIGDSWEEYSYVYTLGGEWICFEGTNGWVPLEDAIKKDS